MRNDPTQTEWTRIAGGLADARQQRHQHRAELIALTAKITRLEDELTRCKFNEFDQPTYIN